MQVKIHKKLQGEYRRQKRISALYLMELIDHNLKKFIGLWTLVSFAPLAAAFLFDACVTGNPHPVGASLLQWMALFSLFSILATVAFTLKMAFYKGTKGHTKLLIIGVAYLILWLAFANLFYLVSDVEAYAACVLKFTGKQVKCFNGIGDFWLSTATETAELVPDTINRLTNYVDCVYFSGISLVTMGYGDIVPVAGFCKILVLLETFSGQVLTVAAAGLCFAGFSGSGDEEKDKEK